MEQRPYLALDIPKTLIPAAFAKAWLISVSNQEGCFYARVRLS